MSQRSDCKNAVLATLAGQAGQTDDLEDIFHGGPQDNDGWLAYFQANGATSGEYNDAAYEWLVAQGVTPAALPDMWYEMWCIMGGPGGGGDPVFQANWYDPTTFEMLTQLVGTGTPTNTHTSTIYADDFNGTYIQYQENMPVWSGQRTNRTGANPTLANAFNIFVKETDIADGDGGNNAVRLTSTANNQTGQYSINAYISQRGGVIVSGDKILISWMVRRVIGTGTVSIFDPNFGGNDTDITAELTGAYQRFTKSVDTLDSATIRMGFILGTSGDAIDVYAPQVELVHDDRTIPYERNSWPPVTGYGAVNLITNGDFVDGSDWVLGTGWTISGGELHVNIGTGFSSTFQTGLTLVDNRAYKIEFDCTAYTQGGVQVQFGTGSASRANCEITATGHYVLYITAEAGGAGKRLQFQDSNANAIMSLDNVRVWEGADIPLFSSKAFATLNGNTVTANVVTEAVGALIDPIPVRVFQQGATNILLNSNVVGTETPTVAIGPVSIVVHVNGVDVASAIVTAGTATATGYATATPGSPVELDVTAGGTITVELTGTPFAVNVLEQAVENSENVGPIITVAAPVATDALPAVYDSANSADTTSSWYMEVQCDGNQDILDGFLSRVAGPNFQLDDGTTQMVHVLTPSFVHKVGIAYGDGLMNLNVDGLWSGADVAYDATMLQGALDLFRAGTFPGVSRKLERYNAADFTAARALIDGLMTP